MPHPTTGPALRPGVVGPHLPPKATVRPPQPCPAPPRAAPRRLRIPPSLSSPGQSLRHRSVATACSRARNLFSRHPSSSRCPSPAFRHSSRTVPSPRPRRRATEWFVAVWRLSPSIVSLAGERIGEGGRRLLGRRTASRGTGFALRASAASARRGQACGVRRARGRESGDWLGRVSPEAWRRRAGELPLFEGDPSAGREDRERESVGVQDGAVVGTPRQPHGTGDWGRRKIFSGSPDAKEDCTRTVRACAVD